LNYGWEEQDILDKLRRIMDTSFDAVWQASETHNSTLRMGAYVVAVKRVVQAMQDRGRS
jgi:glutamate dehydrogenase/leucine dehydrogenase